MSSRARLAVLLIVVSVLSGSPAADPPKSIHELVAAGKIEEVKALLAKDPALVKSRNNDQETPLHVAALRDKPEIIALLLAAGAEVNAQTHLDRTPLHLARNPRIIKMLADAKADLEALASRTTALENAAESAGNTWEDPKNYWGPTIKALRAAGAKYTLRTAVCLGDADGVRELLAQQRAKAKNPPTKKEAERAKAEMIEWMFYAVREGNTAVVKLLLSLKADPTEANYGGLPLPYFALKHPDVAKLLLEAGASAKGELHYIGSGRGPDGTTLLQEAADRGQVETAKLLLAHGAELDGTGSGQHTALQMAAWQGHLDMVKFLIERGANADGARGEKTMEAASRRIRRARNTETTELNGRLVEIIKLLKARGIPVDISTAIALDDRDRIAALLKANPKLAGEKYAAGYPILQRAINLNRKEITLLLLDAGAKVNEAADDGTTALHKAAFWGYEDIVKLLLARKATVDVKDKQGATPLSEAARCGNPATVKLLLAAGADVNTKDDKGMTPLAWADSRIEQVMRTTGKVPDELTELRNLLLKHGGKE